MLGSGMGMLHCSWWLGTLMTGSLQGEAKDGGNPRFIIHQAVSSPCKGCQLFRKGGAEWFCRSCKPVSVCVCQGNWCLVLCAVHLLSPLVKPRLMLSPGPCMHLVAVSPKEILNKGQSIPALSFLQDLATAAHPRSSARWWQSPVCLSSWVTARQSQLC